MSDEILPGGGEESPKPTIVERLFNGDWRSAAIVAGPTVLVAFVLGLVASSFLIWIGAGEDDDFGLFNHSNAGFFRSAFGLTGMAFGSPTFLSSSSGRDHFTSQAGMAPLTITLLTALVFVLLLRRYDAVGTAVERIDLALRAAVLTAIGMALLTIGMHANVHTDGDTLHQSGSPGRAFGWSLLLFVVAALVAAVRSWDLPENIEQLWSKWRLPILGAAVAITTAVVLAGITGIVIIFAQADGGRVDVLKALPMLLAYLVNLGVDVFQIAVGGALRAGGGGDSSSVSLFNRHGLSAAYFFLLLLPPIAISVGITWIRRNAGATSRQEVARACYRMSVPAAWLWLLVAIPSRAGFSVSGTGVDGGSCAVQSRPGRSRSSSASSVWSSPRAESQRPRAVRRPATSDPSADSSASVPSASSPTEPRNPAAPPTAPVPRASRRTPSQTPRRKATFASMPRRKRPTTRPTGPTQLTQRS